MISPTWVRNVAIKVLLVLIAMGLVMMGVLKVKIGHLRRENERLRYELSWALPAEEFGGSEEIQGVLYGEYGRPRAKASFRGKAGLPRGRAKF